MPHVLPNNSVLEHKRQPLIITMTTITIIVIIISVIMINLHQKITELLQNVCGDDVFILNHSR